ncbi:response regulator [Anaerolineales bacterium HSG24]|nr:response regulator [Anaerolineales bacterium HSG24]
MSDLNTSNIELLVVEDNPRYLAMIIEILQEDYGYQHLEVARSEGEAEAKIEQNQFHIIIADMRLENSDSGFTILEKVEQRNITSFVIILTANDTVADCRKAFKASAWDYISKNMRGNPIETLHNSIQSAIAYLNQRNANNDNIWITENISTLIDTYGNSSYIGVINKAVISHAKVEEDLINQLRNLKIPLSLPIIQKIGDSVAEIIERGEGGIVEFKSTLQWDIRQNQANTHLRFASLKTIAAFLNASGGTLLIGVKDEGTIFGLEKDYSLLGSRPNRDGFEQKLTSLINDRLGASFAHYITFQLDEIEEKDVCRVTVKPANEPCFMNDQGGKKFYARLGSTTRQLDVEEAYRYIRGHWE